MAASWSDQDNRQLLIQIIQESNQVTTETLLELLRDVGGIEPNWETIILPHGRNMMSCKEQFSKLTMHLHSANYHNNQLPVKRAWADSPPQGQPTTAPTSAGMSIFPYSTISPRPIQPRPPGSMEHSLSTEPVRKKRGRPTKEEAEARRREAELRGQPYPLPKSRTSDASSGGAGVPKKRGRPSNAELAARKAAADQAERSRLEQLADLQAHGIADGSSTEANLAAAAVSPLDAHDPVEIPSPAPSLPHPSGLGWGPKPHSVPLSAPDPLHPTQNSTVSSTPATITNGMDVETRSTQ